MCYAKTGKKEEQIMQACWQLENAFIKAIINEMPDPKPHYNTIATMVKILEDKGFLAHETIGNVFRYYAVISKDAYQKHAMNDIVSQYFDNSYPNMLMFFAKEQKISNDELNEIIYLINSQKK
nr:BlaI/MecI/CopY family transcriptional regulator [uncultured Mucilaginibacter sp.]